MTRPLRFFFAAVLSWGAVGCAPDDEPGTATITEVIPYYGATGQQIRVLGKGFRRGPASVLFNGIKAVDVDVVSDKEIRCIAPESALGPADVEVYSGGNSGSVERGFIFVSSVDNDPSGGSGANDDFINSQTIAMDFDFRGWIGEDGDLDIYHLHTNQVDGRLFVSATWNASYSSGGLLGLQVEFFHGPDPVNGEDAYFGGQIAIAGDGGPDVPAIEAWSRSFYYEDGHGPYIRIRGIGGSNHDGFDALYGYTLHVRFDPFEPGDPPNELPEPAPSRDSFRLAGQAFALSTSETLSVTNEHLLDEDFDWYRFEPGADGWLRFTVYAPDAPAYFLDTSGSLTLIEAKLHYGNILGDELAGTVDHAYVIPGASTQVSDVPGASAARFEVEDVEAGLAYLLRLRNTNYPELTTITTDTSFAMSFDVEYGAGGIEDGDSQPSPADSEIDAIDLGNLVLNTPVNYNAYSYRDGDDDWFTFTVPVGTVNLVVTWNVTDIRTEVGDYDQEDNPLGGGWGALVFNQAWYDAPGHTSSFLETVGGTAYDYTVGDGVRSVTIPTPPAGDYWLLLDTVTGLSMTNDYTVTVTASST